MTGRSIAKFALLMALTLALARSASAQFSVGLYKDGRLINTFTPVSSPTNSGSKAISLNGGVTVPKSAVVPAVSADAHARDQVFTDAARLGLQLQAALRQMAQPAANSPAVSPPLAELLQQLTAKQAEVRAAYDQIGVRLLELKLPPEIIQRHREAVAANEAAFAALSRAVNDVLAGKSGAREDALKLLEKARLRDEPDLTRNRTTHQTLAVVHAPHLTNAPNAQTAAPNATLAAQPAASPTGFQGGGARSLTDIAPPTSADLATTPDIQFTPAILAKAASLNNDPELIYDFVRNNVAYQAYPGSRKGADFTLQQLAGNDTDQASLLMALLRAAGIPCRYVSGTVDMTPAQVTSWLGVEDVPTAADMLATAGLNAAFYGTNVSCSHVWVEAYVPYSNYRGVPNDQTGPAWVPLDPSFKLTTINEGRDVLTAMGYNNDTFLANYITAYNSNGPIQVLMTNIQLFLNTNEPGTNLFQIERTYATQILSLGLLPASLPVDVLSAGTPFSALASTNRFQITVDLYNGGTTFIDFTTNLCNLAGHEFEIGYVGATSNDQAVINAYGGVYQTPPYLANVKPVLTLDGNILATSTNSIGLGYQHNFDLYFIEPDGVPNAVPIAQHFINAGNGEDIGLDTCLDVPNLFLAATNSNSLLQNLIATTAGTYLSFVDRGEQGADSLLRTVHLDDVSDAVLGSSVAVTYSFSGVPQTFSWVGMFVDAKRRIVTPFGAYGSTSNVLPWMKLTGYNGSFMENDVFESTYSQSAVSTIRILQLTHQEGIPTCYISNSIATACPGFNHSSSVMSAVETALANGDIIIIPQQDFTDGLWSGTGYIDLTPSTGAAGYIISGGISQTVTASGGSTVDTWPIDLGCDPLDGDVVGSITPDGFTDGGTLCASDSYIGYTVDLEYDCEDSDGNIDEESFSDSHTIPMTTLQMVQTSGPGTYTISIPDADVDPVSFTLAYVQFTKNQDSACWQQGGTYNAKALLTSDSTMDDSQLSWTITPQGATIDGTGTVTFGSGGGSYTVTASAAGDAGCSASFTLDVIQVEIQVNNTADTSDDVVRVKDAVCGASYTVPCQARLAAPASTGVTVLIANPDGRLAFPTASSLPLSLPNDQSWVGFSISGQAASASIGDAVIQANLNDSTGCVCGKQGVTVFSFDQAKMDLTAGGATYTVVNSSTAVVFVKSSGTTMNFDASAQLEPAGVDCTIGQIQNLNVSISQSCNFTETTIYGSPTISWNANVAPGTVAIVPTTVTLTITTGHPVADSDPPSNPVYDQGSGYVEPPGGCSGATDATGSDSPGGDSANMSYGPVNAVTANNVVVGTVTYSLARYTDNNSFVDWTVIFDTAASTIVPLQQRTWGLALDSTVTKSQAPTVGATSSAASSCPPTGPPYANTIANQSPQISSTGTTTFTR